MMHILLTFLYAVIALAALVLLASFRHVSLSELKRRAREGDERSRALFRAATYSSGLGLVLWLVAGISSSLFFWSLAHHLAGWLAIVVGTVFVWTILVWLPTRWQTSLSTRVAVMVAPALGWLLGYLHGLIHPVIGLLEKHWPAIRHTGLYDVEDFLEILETQATQHDNRVGTNDLNAAMQALIFSKRQVRDSMTERRHVKAVSAQEQLGPILMSELHESGYGCFPVYEGKPDNIVGTLFLEDLATAKASGQVKDVMHPKVYVLRQDQLLSEALWELLGPYHHLFVVVDSLNEYTGIITARDILGQLVAQPDKQSVMEENTTEQTEESVPTSTEEATEVIE